MGAVGVGVELDGLGVDIQSPLGVLERVAG